MLKNIKGPLGLHAMDCKMETLIIIPTYNEKENLPRLVHEVFENTSQQTDILIVDDNSPDGTGILADQLRDKNKRIHVLHRPGKQGLARAYLAGFSWGLKKTYQWFIEMDADFSHQPKYLKNFEENKNKFDFLIGSRYVSSGGVKNWGLHRKVISKMGSLYSRAILQTKIHDFTGGFNCWSRKVLQSIKLGNIKSDGYSFQIELKYRASQKGFKFKELPIIFEEREFGHSKMSSKIVIEAVVKVWRFRFNKTWN